VDRGVPLTVLVVSFRTSASLPYSSRTRDELERAERARLHLLERIQRRVRESNGRAGDIFMIFHEQRGRRRSVREN
jgi:hypothetical protein